MSKIVEGDKVTICLLNEDSFDGIVEHVPIKTGDCWIVNENNIIHYIQTFSQIIKYPPQKQNEF